MRLSQLHETNLFAYGTLTNPKIRQKALGAPKKGTEDYLDDYQKIERNGYPNIIKNDDTKVKGQRFKLTPKQLSKLDDWEEKYKRHKVKLDSGKEAFVYKFQR